MYCTEGKKKKKKEVKRKEKGNSQVKLSHWNFHVTDVFLSEYLTCIFLTG